MLSQLYIRDFAIVHRLELAFDRGLTVLTGETGAGKSILIDALALALGERAESGVIRHGCTRAEITASFSLEAVADAAHWLREHDLFEDGECVLRRVVEAEKPSKGFINGRPVPMQMLRELGELLVDIHSQHEHHSLLKRDIQRQTLDAYAGLSEDAATLAQQHRELAALESRLAELKHAANDRAARLDLLRYQVQELQSLGLSAEEIPQIEDEHRRLANAAELMQGAQAVTNTLYDDEQLTVTQMLAQAIGKLETLAEYDPKLTSTITLLNEANIQIDEAAAQLHHYLDGLEIDPQRLQWVEQRITAMHELARKHHVQADELPAVLERLSAELGDVEDYDQNLIRLADQIRMARDSYLALARSMSAKRKKAATKLGKEVGAQMQELGMAGGRFEVNLTPLAEGETSSYGLEQTEFVVSANPGQPLRPLAKVASGGELSRISLALQVITAGLGQIPTLIFDEVDVGIGGKVAQIVGQKLLALGERRQVLCITHLAQVAAQGNHHLQVAKRAHEGATVTEIMPLSKKERVQEIARMIGGIEISKQTLAHAEEMLDRASA